MHVVRHVLRFLVVLKWTKSHLNVLNDVLSLLYVGMHQIASHINAIMEPALLVGCLVLKITNVAMHAN